MVALVSLLIIVMLSILITRIITIALTYTGMSRELARFQATSAYTGVGFTTGEAESVVNHPVRRRIVMLTMRLGNIGIVTIVASSVLTFVETGNHRTLLLRLALLIAGLVALWFIARSTWVDHHLARLIKWALEKWTDIDVPDYASLLNLADDFRVGEMIVEVRDWLANKRLDELQLSQEGVLVLGIFRDGGDYVGTPVGETYLMPGDKLIVYGRSNHLIELSRRGRGPFGHLAHAEAVAGQQEYLEERILEDQTHLDLAVVE